MYDNSSWPWNESLKQLMSSISCRQRSGKRPNPFPLWPCSMIINVLKRSYQHDFVWKIGCFWKSPTIDYQKHRLLSVRSSVFVVKCKSSLIFVMDAGMSLANGVAAWHQNYCGYFFQTYLMCCRIDLTSNFINSKLDWA